MVKNGDTNKTFFTCKTECTQLSLVRSPSLSFLMALASDLSFYKYTKLTGPVRSLPLTFTQIFSLSVFLFFLFSFFLSFILSFFLFFFLSFFLVFSLSFFFSFFLSFFLFYYCTLSSIYLFIYFFIYSFISDFLPSFLFYHYFSLLQMIEYVFPHYFRSFFVNIFPRVKALH